MACAHLPLTALTYSEAASKRAMRSGVWRTARRRPANSALV